jgi:prevent-host-death family protein
MAVVSVQDLQGSLDALLDRVESGEPLVVVRDGRPVAVLQPLPRGPVEPRPFGLCAGEFQVPDDFDAPLPEEILAGAWPLPPVQKDPP